MKFRCCLQKAIYRLIDLIEIAQLNQSIIYDNHYKQEWFKHFWWMVVLIWSLLIWLDPETVTPHWL